MLLKDEIEYSHVEGIKPFAGVFVKVGIHAISFSYPVPGPGTRIQEGGNKNRNKGELCEGEDYDSKGVTNQV